MQPGEDARVVLDFAPSSESSFDSDLVTLIAGVAFAGTVIFCACQAFLAPRRVFCSMPQKMD